MKKYNPEIHNNARPNVGVTVVPLVYNESKSQIETLIYSRDLNSEVFPNKISLPNGVYDIRESISLDSAANDALRNKLNANLPYIEQLYTFSGNYIDPDRINTINVSYISILRKDEVNVANNKKELAGSWVSVEELLSKPSSSFAFNHHEVICMAYSRLKSKAEYSSLILNLLPKNFTILSLKNLIELLVGDKINDSRFRDRLKRKKLIEPVIVDGKVLKGTPGNAGGQPPIIYTFNKDFSGSFFPKSFY